MNMKNTHIRLFVQIDVVREFNELCLQKWKSMYFKKYKIFNENENDEQRKKQGKEMWYNSQLQVDLFMFNT